jgi:hypothetical protein
MGWKLLTQWIKPNDMYDLPAHPTQLVKLGVPIFKLRPGLHIRNPSYRVKHPWWIHLLEGGGLVSLRSEEQTQTPTSIMVSTRAQMLMVITARGAGSSQSKFQILFFIWKISGPSTALGYAWTHAYPARAGLRSATPGLSWMHSIPRHLHWGIVPFIF